MMHMVLAALLLSSVLLQAQQNTIFHETFDNNFLRWMQGENEEYAAYVKEGTYQVAHKHPQGAWNFWQSVPIHPDTTYYIESTMTPQMKEERGVYGLIWGVKNLNNYNAFLISSEGTASVVTCQQGVFHRVMPWLPITPYQNNQVHTLALRKHKGRLQFYFDKQLLFKTPILPFYGDLLGFFIAGKTHLSIEQLLVRQDRYIHLIDDTFEGYERRNLGASINSSYAELHPMVTHDGQSLYLTRKGHPDNLGDEKRDDAWVAYRQKDGTWGTLQQLPAPINNQHHNQVIAISPDNNTLLLGNTYTAEGKAKGKGVSISHRQEDGSWSVPQDVIIEQFYNYNPIHSIYLAASGNLLLLSLERNDTHGHLDLYVSFRLPNGHFSVPQNLGSTINTSYIDGTPFLAADGKTLYFSSAGHGGYGSTDIFVSKRLDDTWQHWSQPQNLGPVINSPHWEAHYSISAFGDKAYFVSTQGKGHIGAEDVYEIIPPASARPDPILMVKGKTLDAHTKMPIRAHLVYSNMPRQVEAGRALSDHSTGNYQVVLPPEQNYDFLAYAKGYYPTRYPLNVGVITTSATRYLDLYLYPIEVGQTIPLTALHFDETTDALHPDHCQSLDHLVLFLEKYPNMQIQLQGPSPHQTQQLYDYLVYRGSEPKRILQAKKSSTSPQFTITNLSSKDNPVVYKGDFSPQIATPTLEVGDVFRLSQTLFEADSSNLLSSTKQELQQVVTLLKKAPNLIIEIGGHTNGLPAHAYCDALSSQRAAHVATYLREAGVPANQVQHRGYGKRHPVATNHTLQGRQRNQRVELKIIQVPDAP